MGWLVGCAWLAVAACTDAKTVVDPNATVIEVVVHLEPSLGIDQLRLTSSIGGVLAFAPGTLPDIPRALGATESLDITVADTLDGLPLLVRVDGLIGGVVVGSGGELVTVRARHVTRAEITLGEPAICGDGIIDAPIEPCDDGNTAANDGCTPDCLVQPGWVCTGAPVSLCHLDTFDVIEAQATGNHQVRVTFNGPPGPIEAVALTNYAIPGLTFTGAISTAGDVVLLDTSSQMTVPYTVSVSGVTRAGDGMPLGIKSATFTGSPLGAPTVTDVEVESTTPDNGAVPYNTGTATVRITGSQFTTVSCPTGVQLDDRNGSGTVVDTRAVSCTVDSDSQITATFPAGIRTNGATGWNVQVTNTVSSNVTSAVKFVPRAGLLISEVDQGGSGATSSTHEFIEIYNPTDRTIDAGASGVGLQLHLRDPSGVDTNPAVAYVATSIASHGFLLFVSTASDSGDTWFAHRDGTYVAGVASHGGVYISLSSTAQSNVIDKLGWGAQPIDGFEGTATPNLPVNRSIQRKPAGGAGHATDTDDNSADFDAASAMITPRGTTDAPQP